MEVQVNNIDIFGKQVSQVSFEDKFRIIRELHEFKKATIRGSAYSNELLLIDDVNLGIQDSYKLGIHSSWSGWRICELKEWYEEEWSWSESRYVPVLKGYSTSNNNSLEKYCEEHEEEVTAWFNKYIDIAAYEAKLQEREDYYDQHNNFYYEIDFSRENKCNLYVEGRDDSFYVNGDEHGFSLEVGGMSLYQNDDNSILGTILNLMLKNKPIFDSVTKLNNGYVFNNTYYEDSYDMLYEIEKHIKDNKLLTKFENEGLTLEDFKESKDGD